METNSTLILLSSSILLKKKRKKNTEITKFSVLYFWDDDVALKCAKRPCQVEEIQTHTTMELKVNFVSCFLTKQMKS